MIFQTSPQVLSSYTNDLGETYLTVQLADGSETIMSPSQWEYYLASLEAVEQLQQEEVQQTSLTTSEDDEQRLIDEMNYPLGSEVGEADELTQLPTIYADTGATTSVDDDSVSSLSAVSNTFTEIMDWFGDTFFIEKTNTTTRDGYHTERYSYSSTYQLVQLPFEETVTEVVNVLNPSAVASAVVVILTLITCFTWLKNAIFGRLS